MNGKPPRRLNDDEDALWQGVTRSVAPLRPQSKHQRDQPGASRAARKAAPAPKSVHAAPAKREPARIPALAPLGRRMKQRLARGTETIDGRLDLHGMTQVQAHAALLSFLRSAQASGAKNVLVITGKGGRDAEHGVLKRQVPMWLRLPEFRSLVVGFEDAHIGHGGEGALYVRVRRSK